jgi:putative ATP-dependent endonuclease of the OLD family
MHLDENLAEAQNKLPMLTEDSTPGILPGTADAWTAPIIRRLSIQRFRGIEALSVALAPGVNIMLGGGDAGKTTVLEAIALLLSPTNPTTLADTDYYGRNIAEGFAIEAIMSLPPESGIDYQLKPSWPWEWNGTDAIVPSTDADPETQGPSVYRLRVRGTEDLELVYEIIQPDGTTDNFSVVLRRSIGLVRLGGDDRNDRDLRLVQGSALDRLLSDKSLRSRMASDLANSEVTSQLIPEKQKTLTALDEAFGRQSLPHQLSLAIIGGQGASIASMVGLTAARDGVQLPLASWGAGTRRLSALTIAEQNQGQAPITVVDELERGLEPYRQRALTERLQDRRSQAFVTTHSPFVIEAASSATFWHIDDHCRIGQLTGKKINKIRVSDPSTFLSRLAVVAEGATEVGFVTALLERALSSPLKNHGLHVCNGGGNETTLEVLEALTEGGLCFAGFVDDENKHPTRWQNVATELGSLLFRWPSGCIEKNIIEATPEDKLEAMLIDPENERTGSRLRTLALRLGIEERDFASIASKASTNLRIVMIEAATGKVPPDKAAERADRRDFEKHAQHWFKSEIGGRELEKKLFSLGLWPNFKHTLLPFCNAVLKALHLDNTPDLTPSATKVSIRPFGPRCNS